MDARDTELGQTLIETIFVLTILLILILGIAEFARAWYVKNSLNNAARVGARVGVVEPNLALNPVGTNTPCTPAPTAAIPKAVCVNSPGVPSGASVKVQVYDTNISGGTYADAGDTVTVTVSVGFSGGFSKFTILPWLTGITSLSSQASMRYE